MLAWPHALHLLLANNAITFCTDQAKRFQKRSTCDGVIVATAPSIAKILGLLARHYGVAAHADLKIWESKSGFLMFVALEKGSLSKFYGFPRQV